MGKISSQNSSLYIFVSKRPIGRKFSKMPITREERHMGLYPFGLSLVALSLTYGQNITSKAIHHLGSSLVGITTKQGE